MTSVIFCNDDGQQELHPQWSFPHSFFEPFSNPSKRAVFFLLIMDNVKLRVYIGMHYFMLNFDLNMN